MLRSLVGSEMCIRDRYRQQQQQVNSEEEEEDHVVNLEAVVGVSDEDDKAPYQNNLHRGCGEYSHLIKVYNTSIGRITYNINNSPIDADDSSSMHSQSTSSSPLTYTTPLGEIPASWVLARMGNCVTTIDVLAREYLRHSNNRVDVLRNLRGLRELVVGRATKGLRNRPYAYCIKMMNVKRHTLQILRCTRVNDEDVDVVPEKWSFREVIEHAISLHPACTELYDMLYEWCSKRPHTDIGLVRVVLPMSHARRVAAASAVTTNTNNSTTAVVFPLMEMWGVLLEHDWGNPAVYTKFVNNCPPLGRSKSVETIRQKLMFTIPVYFPKAAETLLPPTATKISDQSYRVDLNAVSALVIALRISPRDGALYRRLIEVMHLEEQRRTYIAHLICATSSSGDSAVEDTSRIVARYFQPNSGGILCHIHIRVFPTTTIPTTPAITSSSSSVTDVARNDRNVAHQDSTTPHRDTTTTTTTYLSLIHI
eukprot:TRINITY_DN7284_c0_g1_i1.p1 TRINITY_DN7284_c0_g1~~TRINITY_DN7284_c0_g1_i1.p1  ORF type:complete len:518 (+),score=54.26 TRINITY_DN7284_c0_g1_i1:117-1556(+)